MTQRIPEWLKFPLVLMIVSVISAVSLAGLQALTDNSRKTIEDKETEAALKVIFPSADSFVRKENKVDGDKFVYWIAMKDKAPKGYVSEGSATGYSSTIRVMVGVDLKFVIQGIKVLSQKETPGLGDKILEVLSKKTWGAMVEGLRPDERSLRPWFQIQFDGKKVPVKVDKDGGDIESITGATISSRAVCEAVNQAVDRLKKAVGS